ncbi:TPA: fimbrial biogenesis outer membrane usher protein [Salmonella enterica subsp. enterica]|nr:fimbrial biogenesis outer membrane usher protein [Salmonella enterica subsp. enterica]
MSAASAKKININNNINITEDYGFLSRESLLATFVSACIRPAWCGYGCSGLILLTASLLPPVAAADDADSLSFNPSFLRLSDGDRAKDIDLSYFSSKGGQLPGDYEVDVILNGQRVDTATLHFISQPDHPGKLFACLNEEDLTKWGLRPLPDDKAGQLCKLPVSSLYPEASEKLDLGKHQWLLSVPQKFLLPPGWMQVSPRLWQEGMPALLLNYDYSGYQQNSQGQNSDSQYLGLDSSLSVGGWRLRNTSNWTQQGGASGYSRWTSLNTYLQRDYAFGQGGMLTAGQTYTSGDFFDSFSFTGIKAESDDGMLNSALTSYSPVIRGIANSQAQVTIRQNGSIIYQKSVPPGPFELHDVNTVNSGDLQVEVKEADGSVHSFTQVSASVPVLQRQGRVRYGLSAGRYRNDGLAGGDKPLFVQGQLAVGLPAEFTAYGGVMAAQGYQAAMAGVGRYSSWLGAFSFDVTQARSVFSDNAPVSGTQQGQQLRFSWARGFDATGTSLNLAGYRYATRGFYSFTEQQEQEQEQNAEFRTKTYHTPHLRSRVQLAVSQPLGWQGEFGVLSVSGNQDQYWDESSFGRSWNASYSNTFGGVSLGVSAGLNSTPQYSRTDKMMTLTLSVPLSRWLSGSSVSVNSTTTTYNSRTSSQMGISGAGMDGRLNYSVQEGWQNQDGGNTGTANASWQGGYGQATAGYSYYQGGRQWNWGLHGGLAVHPHGATLSQTLSMNDGNALVMAPGAAGIRVKNGTGVHTDWFGYAVVPNLMSYQHNHVSLDVSDLPENVDAKSSDQDIVPTRGALVASPFHIAVGYRALITLQRAAGSIPLGAGVVVKQGDEVISRGVVDNDQVYMSGLPESGTLQVTWYNGNAEQGCQADYHLNPSDTGLSQITAVCR